MNRLAILIVFFFGLSNFYSYTRCSYATNIFTITIKFSIKNLLAKPPSSSQRKKAQEGKIKTPRSSCTMRAQPLPGPRHQVTGVSLLPHHCPYSNCCPPPSSTCAGGPHKPFGGRLSRVDSQSLLHPSLVK